jgi:hypothetical protein
MCRYITDREPGPLMTDGGSADGAILAASPQTAPLPREVRNQAHVEPEAEPTSGCSDAILIGVVDARRHQVALWREVRAG